MLTWKEQDRKLAYTLRDYGFTTICRISRAELGVYFDNGPYRYSLPGLCFLFMDIGDFMTIDALINRCEENCL